MAEGNTSSGNLFSSSKLVADAAVSVFQQKSTENVDKKEVAGAAAEILQAASTYGKLEDKPAGQYIEKAEGYLNEFSTGHAADGAEKPAPAPAGDAPKPAEPAEDQAPKEPVPAPAPAVGEEGKSSEGFALDDAMKGAEQLLEKKAGGEESAGGGAGGLFKMAQGFLK